MLFENNLIVSDIENYVANFSPIQTLKFAQLKKKMYVWYVNCSRNAKVFVASLINLSI